MIAYLYTTDSNNNSKENLKLLVMLKDCAARLLTTYNLHLRIEIRLVHSV